MRALLLAAALAAGNTPGAPAPARPASPGPSAARGKALFEDRSLGTNGRTCADCHAGGKRLDEVAETPDAQVSAYVNSCIDAMLAGRPLPEGSDDLKSLVLHLRAIAPGKR
jgi:cytochrome c peroxidase